MRSHNTPLFVVLAFLLAFVPACSSRALPEQRVEAKATDARSQQNPTAAIVKAKKANLREHPSQFAIVVGTVRQGDLLSLTDATPTGPWYRIRHTRTGADGWIHGNTIALLQTAETAATSATRPRTVSTPAKEPGKRSVPAQEPRTQSVPAQEPRAVSTQVETKRTTSPPRSYVNKDGIRVQSPTFSDTKPAGASARCRDGSYSFSLNRRGTCSHHGGVAVWY